MQIEGSTHETTPQGTSVETESVATQTETPASTETTQQSAPSPVDLDKLEKFMLGGKEWSSKDLRNSILMQSDYTRKTKELATQRKTFEHYQNCARNLEADLENLRGNPALVSEFKRIYPKEFHSFLKMAGINEENQNGGQTAVLDPALVNRLDQLEGRFKEQDEKTFNTYLDSLTQKFNSKYPYAYEAEVLSRAESLVQKKQEDLRNQGMPTDKVSLSDAEWESLWKLSNERVSKIAQAQSKAQYEKQKQANLEGRDLAAGGGTPSSPPRGYKTFSEAAEAHKRFLEESRT